MTDTPEEVQIRPFAAVLQELAKGEIHTEASEKLHALIDAVQEHCKAGTLTLKVEVGPVAKGDASVLLVKASVESRPPKTPPSSAYYVDGTGNLSRRDPKQPELPFGVVGTNTTRSAAQ